jgi:16S rRNA (cytosine967-C5)-methyltransferase
MAANNSAAPNVIRLNLSRGSRAQILERLHGEGFELGAGGRALETIVLKSAAIFDSPSYNEGLFHAQSEASQMVVRMLGPKTGSRVLDCAAAPGGSSASAAGKRSSRVPPLARSHSSKYCACCVGLFA